MSTDTPSATPIFANVPAMLLPGGGRAFQHQADVVQFNCFENVDSVPRINRKSAKTMLLLDQETGAPFT
jgi:hypothetical protein